MTLANAWRFPRLFAYRHRLAVRKRLPGGLVHHAGRREAHRLLELPGGALGPGTEQAVHLQRQVGGAPQGARIPANTPFYLTMTHSADAEASSVDVSVDEMDDGCPLCNDGTPFGSDNGADAMR